MEWTLSHDDDMMMMMMTTNIDNDDDEGALDLHVDYSKFRDQSCIATFTFTFSSSPWS